MPRPPAKPYTLAEKRRILQYIIRHSAYYQVKGNSLWIKMQSEFQDVHSWQSLKEHYRKQLLPRLALADFNLTEAQIASFRQGYGELLNKKRKEQLKYSSFVPFYKLWPGHEDDVPCKTTGDLAAAQLGGHSKIENGKDEEVSQDKTAPNTCDKTRTWNTNGSSQMPDTEAGSTNACSTDSPEGECKEVESQTSSCGVNSEDTTKINGVGEEVHK